MTTPQHHPQTGQFLPATSWADMTSAGARDTASAPPPSFADQLPDDLWAAPPAAQIAAKLELSASNGTRPSGQPDTSATAADAASEPGFLAGLAKIRARRS